MFDLKLEHGPYRIAYSQNGQHLLLGGRKGHLAMLEWKRKDLVCEFSAKERVRDVAFLQSRSMFAVAQKEYLYTYDE